MKKGERHKVKGVMLLPIGLLIVLLLMAGISGYAQRVSATLDRDKIVLGEQVTLQLKVMDVNPRTSFMQQWFMLPDSINHLSVVKTDLLDTVDVNGLTTYLQRIVITSYDSGHWAIPLSPVTIQDKATGKPATLKADSLFLDVLPVDVSNLKDYHDIKEIIDVPATTDYTLIIAAIASVIIVIVLMVLIMRRKKRPVIKATKPVASGRPLDEALRKLKELQAEGLPAKGQVKLFYTKLDEIIREYFNRKMNMQAMQLTTDEIMVSLAVYLQDKQAKTSFYQLLRLIDAVKFAKYLPGDAQHTEAISLATTGLQHIDNQIQLSIRHVD